jgi:hypothetical protein
MREKMEIKIRKGMIERLKDLQGIFNRYVQTME